MSFGTGQRRGSKAMYIYKDAYTSIPVVYKSVRESLRRCLPNRLTLNLLPERQSVRRPYILDANSSLWVEPWCVYFGDPLHLFPTSVSSIRLTCTWVVPSDVHTGSKYCLWSVSRDVQFLRFVPLWRVPRIMLALTWPNRCVDRGQGSTLMQGPSPNVY
jgi:hypothetical protein